MKFRDLPAAKFGRFGEQLAASMLRRVGAGVVASFKFSGENDNQAPAIELHEKRITLPDTDVSMRESARRSIGVDVPNRFWLEIKTYKEPQFNRAHRTRVHGVPMRLFDEYCESETQTGTPVYLGILEVDSGSLIVSNVPLSQVAPRYSCLCGCDNDATKCEYRSKWGASYPQWYFRRDSFTEWYQLKGVELARLQAEHSKVSHAIRKHGSSREPTTRGVLSRPAAPWTWTCLPCNATGVGDHARHRCQDAQPWRRDFWIQRFRWAMPAASNVELAAFVDKPITRTRIAELLGSQWLATGDMR